jgi:FG-GAP-like repeat
MAIIDLGQTLTGTFNSATPFDGTSYYTDYDLPTLNNLSQIRVTFNPNGINTPGTTNIDLINATTGAILSENSASGYTGSSSVGLVDETIYPGITYKLRVSNTKLANGNYSLSLETLGQATSIVSRGFVGSNGSYGYQIGTLNATGGYAPLASAYDTVADVALSPSGLLYGISPSVSTYTADRLYVIDPSLGVDYINISANSVRNLKDPNGSILLQSLKSLAFSSDNKLYAIGTSATGTGGFYQIDLNTKVATLLAILPTGFNNSGDLVYDAANDRFLASSIGDTGTSDTLWQIPLTNPASATKLGQIGFLNVRGLAVEDDRIIGYAPATGTNSGTNKITINASTGVGTFAQNLLNYSDISGAATILPLTVPVRNDFDGDGKSDILWRNTDGSLALWQMNGSTATPSSIGALPAGWTTAGTGDFNGDGKADMLLSNANGSVATWQMNGSKVSKGNIIGTLVAGWSIAGMGDFNGDGTNDVLMTNTNGTVAEWQIDNGTVTESKTIGKLTNGWSIAGAADFNGDGKTDILLKNTDGSIAEWQMNGSVLAAQVIGAVTPDWTIAGTGDFNGDGKSDLLFRNTNGSVAEWQMNGSTVTATAVVGSSISDWKISGTGDYNGDGKADILWRNDNGGIAQWQMNGNTVLSAGLTSVQSDSSWKIATPNV